MLEFDSTIQEIFEIQNSCYVKKNILLNILNSDKVDILEF